MKKQKSYKKQYYKDIAAAIKACPDVSPAKNPVIPTGPNTAKMTHPFQAGFLSGEFAVDHVAVLLRVLTKQDITITFEYVDKETGELLPGQVERKTKQTFLKELRA